MPTFDYVTTCTSKHKTIGRLINYSFITGIEYIIVSDYDEELSVEYGVHGTIHPDGRAL